MNTFYLFLVVIVNPIWTLFVVKNYDNKCLERITETFLNPSTLVVSKNLQMFIPKTAIYVTESQDFNSFNSSYFLIYLENFLDAKILFPKLHKGKNYVIVIQEQTRKNVKEILALSHQHRIINMVVVNRFEHSSTIYTVKNPCESFKIEEKNCKNINNPFRRKLIFGKKCSMKIAHLIDPPFVQNVSQNQNPGISVSLFNLMQEITGISMDYTVNCSNFNYEMLTNGSLHQITEALKNGQFQAAIGRLFMNDTITTPFDLGPMLFTDQLDFVVPTPRKLKSYRKLLVVFQKELWMKLLTALLVMFAMSYILGLCEDFHKTNVLNVIFDIFGISIGTGLTVLPRRTSWRILLIFFFMFSLSIDSVYLSKLSSIFATSSYDVSVKNIAIATKKEVIFVYSWQAERLYMLKYVTRHLKPKTEKGKRLFIVEKNQVYMLNHTALAKENGTLLFRSLLKSHPSEAALLNKFYVHTGFMTFFVTFYLKKNEWWNDALAFWAKEAVEKGFIGKWFEDIRRSNVKIDILPEDEEKVMVLKLAHFEESFRMLIGGYVVAFVGLLLEFIFLKLEKIGIIRSVRNFLIFLIMLLKPPELKKDF